MIEQFKKDLIERASILHITIEELDNIIIGEAYRIVTIDNIPQNFVLEWKKYNFVKMVI